MKSFIFFTVTLIVLKDTQALNPEITKYDKFMRDFENIGRRFKTEKKNRMEYGANMEGSMINKRDDGNTTITNLDEADSTTEEGNWRDRFQYEQNQILDEKTLDAVARYIKKKNCKNIITIAGAGISTSAGIPDYDDLKKNYNITNPSIFFDCKFFNEYPETFFAFASLLSAKNRLPTRTHYFVRLLQEKGLLLRHYTTNVDALERKAGINSEKLIETKGSFHASYCLNCCAEYDQKWMEKKLDKKGIPRCEKCAGIVKPDINLSSNETAIQLIMNSSIPLGARLERVIKESFWDVDIEKCDLVIMLGFRFIIPFDVWIPWIPQTVPRLLINKELTDQNSGSLRLEVKGKDFNPTNNSRDVFWEGLCDDGCQLLADKLGWGEELKLLIKEENMKIIEASSHIDADDQ